MNGWEAICERWSHLAGRKYLQGRKHLHGRNYPEGQKHLEERKHPRKWVLAAAAALVLVGCTCFVSYGKTFTLSDEKLQTGYDPIQNDYYFDLSFTYHGEYKNFVLVVYLNGTKYNQQLHPYYASAERLNMYIRWTTPVTEAEDYLNLRIQRDFSAYLDSIQHNNVCTAVDDRTAKLHFRVIIRNIQENVSGISVTANMDGQNIANVWGGDSGWDVQSDLVAPSYEGTLKLTATVPQDTFAAQRGYPAFRFVIASYDGKKKYILLALQPDSPVQDGQYVLQKTIPLSGFYFTITQKPVAVYAEQEAQTVRLTKDGETVSAVFSEQLRPSEKEAFVTVKIH